MADIKSGNELLAEIYRNTHYALQSISDIMPETEDAELCEELKKTVTIVAVTHNMQHATRISDKTGIFLMGKLIEFNDTEEIFSSPKDKQTENYITGRFG